MNPGRPEDHAERERFASELGANASLIAPAGTGKTTALVERIVRIASPENTAAMEWLPRLVVVTYTNSAAEEMRQRARNAIIRQGARGAVLAQFNRAFFGTIHSFCLMLLRRHGCHLGLPSRLEIAQGEDLDALWRTFLRRGAWGGNGALAAGHAEVLFRHVSMLDVLDLGREAPQLPAKDPGPPPRIEPGALLGFAAGGKGAANIERGQAMVRRWIAEVEAGAAFAPLPDCPGGGKAFEAQWMETFRPLREWLGKASWVVAREAASGFRGFRLGQGRTTFDDQVALAGRLMRHPEAAAAVRAEGYRVILDEAQDTDREQFVVLSEVGRSEGAGGVWLDAERGAVEGPAPGRFAMVGDPQQSIYGRRAGLSCYQEVRERLVKAGGFEAALRVTFRCDEAVVDVVNGVAPGALDGREGQVAFVPLRARPGAGPGFAVRLPLAAPVMAADVRRTEVPLARAEAGAVARWLKAAGIGGLRARDWSEVAVLCPRRRWLEAMEAALRDEGLDVQNRSARETCAGSAAYSWFVALVWVMAEPRDGFEIAGVLREIFGLADADIAEFTCGEGERLSLAGAPVEGGQDLPVSAEKASGATAVADVLARLAALRTEVAGLPLGGAVRRLVESVGLPGRLNALPEDDRDAGMLDVLLLRAAAAEEEGLTLGEWAEQLRAGFGARREGESVRRGAVQLITCHKAKGLQWDCVVLPFLCRPVRGRSAGYPRVVPVGAGEAPAVVFGKGDLDAAQEQALHRVEIQETQRLMYVAMTRARRTLVFVDDRAVFDKRADSLHDQARFGDGDAAAAFEGLPVTLPEPEGGAGPVLETPTALPAPAIVDVDCAVRAAEVFAKRRLPHALAERDAGEWLAEPEAVLETVGERGAPAWLAAQRAAEAAEYGIWWHALMERLPWVQGPAAWDEVLGSRLDMCPDCPRAQREFGRFRAAAFIGALAAGGRVFHAELPFLWRDAAGSCLEGVIDLAAFDPGAGKWIVVDWKTNLIAADGMRHLAVRYRPQLDAYAAALRALAPGADRGIAVEAFLYSTALGEAVAVGTACGAGVI